jgi:hypothetical protein
MILLLRLAVILCISGAVNNEMSAAMTSAAQIKFDESC